MRNEASISLVRAHADLGWPPPEQVTDPKGASAAKFASLVRDKIGRGLKHLGGDHNVVLGVLTADPLGAETEPPLAIVAEFHSAADDASLRELHRLSWNFSHSPALVTLEPSAIKVWSCCESPDSDRPLDEFVVHELWGADIGAGEAADLEARAASALHWINLVSGEFFRQYPDRFHRDGRADQVLLGNLRHIRARLAAAGVDDDDICHDLLARVIFVQFLFDRKDSDGAAALTASRLARLHGEGVLRHLHTDFVSILSNYGDTYALFDWLNTRFNGDLFPGKGDTVAARERGWAKEKRVVKKQHLSLLAEFIRGDVNMPTGQLSLWPQYSFDVIPLEFISSIYETFVAKRASEDGIFYTPPHLVDLILDRVLPWDGQYWDLTILDPACGSGVFLVKAFQRLVHRWKRANPGQPVRAEVLRRLLERNIFGVDKDPHAVRVACFSLYLAMCDEIEPRHYWTQVIFPPMREQRLVCSDFFEEQRPGFDTDADAKSYDLIVGNAPWGDGVVTERALKWANASSRGWTVPNKDVGGLFLAKSTHLLKQHGRIAMIQSANSLLFNRSPTAVAFRTKLFSTYRIEEILNLSALRFEVFKRKTHTSKKSTAPACVIVMSAETPSAEHRISYTCPKQLKPLMDDFVITIEPQDRSLLTVRDAVSDASCWTALMWGGQRDRTLLRKLRSFPTLRTSGESDEVKCGRGIQFGDRKKPIAQLANHRLFDSRDFPPDKAMEIDATSLPRAGNLMIHSRESTDFTAFAFPQLLIKRSWQKASGRFQARLVRSRRKESVVCNQSYVSAHGPVAILEAACLVFNSMVAVYFMQLTSGRIAAYRPEALINEIRDLPLPPWTDGMLDGLDSYGELDTCAFEAFNLKDAERVLIEDMFEYTLPDFHGDENSRGRRSTAYMDGGQPETFLRAYCEYFIRVLKAGFGREKAVTATIFRPDNDMSLPYRIVAFQLGRPCGDEVTVRLVKQSALVSELERLNELLRTSRPDHRGIYNERVVRIYDGANGVPTIFVVKPDMARYWTRSAGLNDGDQVALDLFRWSQAVSGREVPQ